MQSINVELLVARSRYLSPASATLGYNPVLSNAPDKDKIMLLPEIQGIWMLTHIPRQTSSLIARVIHFTHLPLSNSIQLHPLLSFIHCLPKDQNQDQKSYETMSEIHINTPNAPKPPPFLSQATVANNTVFCSGQLGIDPKTEKMVEGSVKDRTVSLPTGLFNYTFGVS